MTDVLTLPVAERDRLAAEKILRWEAIHLSYPICCYEIEWKIGADDYIHAINFQPSKNAASDYLILQKVRTEWQPDDVMWFSRTVRRAG